MSSFFPLPPIALLAKCQIIMCQSSSYLSSIKTKTALIFYPDAGFFCAIKLDMYKKPQKISHLFPNRTQQYLTTDSGACY